MSKVTRKELAEIIGEKTLQSKDTRTLARNIAAYVSAKHMTVDIDSLLRDVMQYRLERGYVEAIAVSAHELNPTVIKDIKDLLAEHFPGSKSVRVDTRIDDSLVGGVRIELPQESLDLSVRNKLNMFKRLVAEEGR
jgi:F0F1-type ATP synthase delta subunit